MIKIINIQPALYGRWRNDIKDLLKVSSTTSFPNIGISESYYDIKCDELEQYLSCKQAIVFLAITNEKAIGFIWVHQYHRFDELRLHISHFAVLPHFQRQGIGMKLYQEVVAYAKIQQINCLELLVSSSDTSAVNFYSKCGFEVERHLMKKQV